MVTMKALVGFSDRDLAGDDRPQGGVAASATFRAPSAEIASRLEAAGLAERVKAPATAPATAPSKA
jgi:hypothetical protein